MKRRPFPRVVNGLTLYNGPSLLDGSPVVCIATGLLIPTQNRATGPMAQTWILREDIDPVTARREGRDAGHCGDCKLRHGGCYVSWFTAPLQVWKAYKAGHYPAFDPSRHAALFPWLYVRVGSAGDPAAVPYKVWASVLRKARGWTGYTHGWRSCDQRLRRWLMASVDTPQERSDALARGWKTFRTRLPEEPLLDGEFTCPKSNEFAAEHGHRRTCRECLACKGGAYKGQATPVTAAHGGLPQLAAYRRVRLSLPVV